MVIVQEFHYYETPSPHIIIDNFLEPRLAAKCLEEAIRLEPFYEDATVGGDVEYKAHLEDCAECKLKYNSNRMGIRDNDVIYLDRFYDGKRIQSPILEGIQSVLKSPAFNSYMATMPNLFKILNHTTSIESILSRYGKCDFYGWHTDTFPSHVNSRVITLCYYFNKEPEEFEGGDLIITGKTVHDALKVKPKHNRAVIFESNYCTHAVDTVKLKADNFDGGRFSINCWLGFSSQGYNYRE